MSSPIRVGLVGLGKGPMTLGPGVWGAAVHLPYLRASPKYTLVAVQNSSIESAQASIDWHKLPSTVKAYGTPEDLAKDPNVDLVVVCVIVDKHYGLAKPALLAGKDVFVEWPLGASTAEAEDLTKVAKETGSKTIMGLQARASPLVLKVKDLVQSGKIGKVLNSIVIGQISTLGAFGTWPESAAYYTNFDSGANGYYVSFAHFLDCFTDILGPFKTVNSTIHNAFPTINLVDSAGKVTKPNYPKSSPDHIFVQGTLTSGAVVSLSHYTSPSANIDSIGTRWLITGTDGSIDITTSDMSWQMGPPATLKARIGRDSEVETVEWEPKEGVEGKEIAGFPGGNTQRLYEAFAGEGREGEFATFEQAVETHRLLDRIRSAAGK